MPAQVGTATALPATALPASQGTPAPQRMAPPPASATGRATRFGFALRGRALALLLLGCVGVLPYIVLHLRPAAPLLLLLGWNALVLAATACELARLPRTLTVTRTFEDTPALGHATQITLTVAQPGQRRVRVRCADALAPALAAMPVSVEGVIFAHEAAALALTVVPVERGDHTLGAIYARIRGSLGLAEWWVVVRPAQRVRVYPTAVRAGSDGELPLLDSRRMEMERRRLRRRGLGREFESLRDFEPGDALRDISWTATARRGRLMTRNLTAERSQQVWVLLDAGRLSRTTAAVRSVGVTTQLDAAADTALLLARAVCAAGDRAALLVYGRLVRHLLLPGAGAHHLRLAADLLAQAASERGEANHLRAVLRLASAERRRSLIVWITEPAESLGTPEIAVAAGELARRHVVLLLLIEHPDVTALAAQPVLTAQQMFAAAAAREMEERRTTQVAALERAGALVIRTTSARLAADALREYLAIKGRGLI